MLGLGLDIWTPAILGIGVSPVAFFDAASSTLPSFLSHSRAGNAMMFDATGRLTYAPANLLLHSQAFDNAAWVKVSGGGSGLAAVVTADAGTAPDGTTTADRVQLSLNGGTTTADISNIRQALTFEGNAVFSFWARSFDGVSSYVAQITGPTGVGQNITITGNWQRFSISGAQAGAVNYAFRLRGGQAPANSNVADVLLWGAQVEPVTYQTTPSSYTATTSAAFFGSRFDFDPATLASRGLLIEGARTNLALWSQQQTDALWTKQQSTVASSPQNSPAGIPAMRISEDATNSFHFINQTVGALTAGTVYTASAYLRQGTQRFAGIHFNDGTSRGVSVDLQTGTLGTPYGGATASIVPLSGGWYRLSITATCGTTTASGALAIYLSNSNALATYTGNPANNIDVFGAQLEVGSYPTSYIPTTSATVTRAADVVTLTGAAAAAFTSGVAASVVVEVQLQGITNIGRLIGFNTGDTPIYVQTNTELRHYSATATPITISAFPQTGSFTGGPVRAGGAGTATARRIVMGGGTVASDANSFFGAPISTVNLGSQSGTSPADGWYSRLAIWNTVLSDPVLRAKTVLGAPL